MGLLLRNATLQSAFASLALFVTYLHAGLINHAIKEHFSMLPIDILLELIERILKDPTKIFEQEKLSQYHLFYRLDNGKYLVVIIKRTSTGNYFSTMYGTGDSVRNTHKGLKEIKP